MKRKHNTVERKPITEATIHRRRLAIVARHIPDAVAAHDTIVAWTEANRRGSATTLAAFAKQVKAEAMVEPAAAPKPKSPTERAQARVDAAFASFASDKPTADAARRDQVRVASRGQMDALYARLGLSRPSS